MSWNFDVENVPKGHYEYVERRIGKNEVTLPIWKPVRVIVATACGTVTLSQWLPSVKLENGSEEGGRWEMLSKKDTIIAWQPWPEHPEKKVSID